MSRIHLRRKADPVPKGQPMEQALRRQMAWAAGTEQFQHRDPLYHVTENFQQTFDAMGRRHAAQMQGETQENAGGEQTDREPAAGLGDTSSRAFY